MSKTSAYLIEELGGGVPEGRSLKAVIPGGASSPILGPEALDILCAPEALAAAGSMAGSAGGHGHRRHAPASCSSRCARPRSTRTRAAASARRAARARAGSTDTLRRIEEGIAAPAEIELVLEICDNVEGKCLCPLGDACAMPVRSMVKRFREEFEAHVELGSLPAARLLDAQLPLPAAPQPAAAADGGAVMSATGRRDRHARDRRPRADRAEGHAARAGRRRGRDRDPDLLLRAPARARRSAPAACAWSRSRACRSCRPPAP